MKAFFSNDTRGNRYILEGMPFDIPDSRPVTVAIPYPSNTVI